MQIQHNNLFEPTVTAVGSESIGRFYVQRKFTLLPAVLLRTMVENGTAAGILNAAASLGLMLQYCVFGSVAQNYGWVTVTTLWIVMVVLGIAFCLLTVFPANRFKKQVEGKKE